MNSENKKLLEDEIRDELKTLSEMEIGSDSYKATADILVKLVDRSVEIEKLDIEREEKAKTREIEQGLKLQAMAEERQDRLVKNCISVAGIVIPVIITIWGTVKSFEFEKEGTITTIMGRGFINKLLPHKW